MAGRLIPGRLILGRLILGAAMCVVGGVWFFQGIGVIEGSFMTGQAFWTVIGVILLALGLRMMWRARPGAQPPSAE